MNIPLSFKNNWKQANQKSIFEVWLTKEQRFLRLGPLKSRTFFQGIWAYENPADGSWLHMKTCSVKKLTSKSGPAVCTCVPRGQSWNTFKDFIQLIFTTSRAYWRMTNFIAIFFFFFLIDEEVKVDWLLLHHLGTVTTDEWSEWFKSQKD